MYGRHFEFIDALADIDCASFMVQLLTWTLVSKLNLMRRQDRPFQTG